jgi:hypothetical protein
VSHHGRFDPHRGRREERSHRTTACPRRRATGNGLIRSNFGLIRTLLNPSVVLIEPSVERHDPRVHAVKHRIAASRRGAEPQPPLPDRLKSTVGRVPATVVPHLGAPEGGVASDFASTCKLGWPVCVFVGLGEHDPVPQHRELPLDLREDSPSKRERPRNDGASAFMVSLSQSRPRAPLSTCLQLTSQLGDRPSSVCRRRESRLL